MIASLSGIRGVVNKDLSFEDVESMTSRFAEEVGPTEVYVARDTRRTSAALERAVVAALLSRGCKVSPLGVVSTPALFRETRVARKGGVMVTASHNEPEFNGLKFLVSGAGITEETFNAMMEVGRQSHSEFVYGSLGATRRVRYDDDLLARFGEGTCKGVSVAVDLGGGAAISHAPGILTRLGCEVTVLNGTYGVFSRRIDPTSDELFLLRRVVRSKGCDIGLGFDCDGDRLVLMDCEGDKKTGDFMLALALSKLLVGSRNKKVVVSVDTTQAIEELVGSVGGSVFRSKVGEANVVQRMKEVGADLGGEGSSGGLIDRSFNYCRDSMLAALVIIRSLAERGRRAYEGVRAYHQSRAALRIPRSKASKVIRKMAAKYDKVDVSDGVKVFLPRRAWVLIRPSGTEDIVRVSAEADKATRADQLVKAFSKRVKELSK